MRLYQRHGAAEAVGWLEDGECTVLSVVSLASSNLGKGHATIALHRLMADAVRLGAQRIVVDNVTDDPARAARGLYRLFQWVEEGRGPEMVLWVDGETLARIRDVVSHPRRCGTGCDADAPRDGT